MTTKKLSKAQRRFLTELAASATFDHATHRIQQADGTWRWVSASFYTLLAAGLLTRAGELTKAGQAALHQP